VTRLACLRLGQRNQTQIVLALRAGHYGAGFKTVIVTGWLA